jgi:hypothetical protein
MPKLYEYMKDINDVEVSFETKRQAIEWLKTQTGHLMSEVDWADEQIHFIKQ